MSLSRVTHASVLAAQGRDMDAMAEIIASLENLINRRIADAIGNIYVVPEDVRDDLRQAARVAIVEKIYSFDAGAGASFETYVYPFIGYAVRAEWLAHKASGPTIPTDTAMAVNSAMGRARAASATEYQQALSDGDYDRAALVSSENWIRERAYIILTARPGKPMTHVTFVAALDALDPAEMVRLDAPGASADDDDSTNVADILAGMDITPMSSSVGDRLIVHWLLKKLTPRRAFILCAKFGIGDVPEMDDADVAAALGTTRGNVRIERHRAMDQARKLLTSSGATE